MFLFYPSNKIRVITGLYQGQITSFSSKRYLESDSPNRAFFYTTFLPTTCHAINHTLKCEKGWNVIRQKFSHQIRSHPRERDASYGQQINIPCNVKKSEQHSLSGLVTKLPLPCRRAKRAKRSPRSGLSIEVSSIPNLPSIFGKSRISPEKDHKSVKILFDEIVQETWMWQPK